MTTRLLITSGIDMEKQLSTSEIDNQVTLQSSNMFTLIIPDEGYYRKAL